MANEEEKLFLESIKNGEIDEVEKFIQKYPKVKNVFCDAKKSAPATALKYGRIEIYKTLIRNGYRLDPEEDINNIMKSLLNENRKCLLELHNEYRVDIELDYLAVLNKKSKLAHHTLESEQKYFCGLVATAFSELNEIEWIQPILKIVAMSEKLTITFDFTRDSIEHMDPTKQEDVMGTTYPTGSVYVGVKKLSNGDGRFQALGVIAHELCHYAMMLIYDNSCRPYCYQSEFHQNFDNILHNARAKKDVEPCIGSVFASRDSQWHAELIARVPHLLALYKKDEQKMEEVKELFGDLFEFFERKTLTDLERAYPLIKAKQTIKLLNCKFMVLAELEISKIVIKDEHLGKFEFADDKVYSVCSNCPQLTIQMIYQQSIKYGSKEKFIFIKLQNLTDDENFELLKKALHSTLKPVLIIDCINEKVDEIYRLYGKLQAKQLLQRIVLVHNHNDLNPYGVENFKKTFSWVELTAESQNSLLKTQIFFQGNKNVLRTII